MGYYLLIALCAFTTLIEFNREISIKKKRGLCFVLLLPLFFMAAFRDISVGNDTSTYSYAFNVINSSGGIVDAVINSRFEPGFVVLNYICGHIGLDYLGLQVITELIIYASVFRFIVKYSSNISFSVLLFITTRAFFGTMNTMRMWLAVSILLFAVDHIMRKHHLKFIMTVVLATMFHFSAIVFFVVGLLAKKKMNRKIILASTVIAVGIRLLGNGFFISLTNILGRYQGYLSSGYFQDEIGSAVFLSMAVDICFIALAFYAHFTSGGIEGTQLSKKLCDGEVPFYQVCNTAMFICILVDIIGTGNLIMSRIASFFSVMFIIVVADSISLIRNGRQRFIIHIVVVAMLILQFVIIFKMRPGWFGVDPYVLGIGK